MFLRVVNVIKIKINIRVSIEIPRDRKLVCDTFRLGSESFVSHGSINQIYMLETAEERKINIAASFPTIALYK